MNGFIDPPGRITESVVEYLLLQEPAPGFENKLGIYYTSYSIRTRTSQGKSRENGTIL